MERPEEELFLAGPYNARDYPGHLDDVQQPPQLYPALPQRQYGTRVGHMQENLPETYFHFFKLYSNTTYYTFYRIHIYY